ncbi:MAG TPA: tyrosine-type recombinase/integrase [Usitatibacter sp.]|nr:tyrosine-type recombinase/integrase [Usitatibacter sp.]
MPRTPPRLATAKQREQLAPRREPYWNNVASRGYLGYRRTLTGGSWIARYRHANGKQEYNALKLPLHIPEGDARDVAQKMALKWFEDCARGAVQPGSGGYKVSDAATAYVASLRARKGDSAASDAEGRINLKIKPSTLWSKRVDRLTRGDIEEWRNTQVPAGVEEEATRKAKDTANRNLTVLKALLNHAWKSDRVAQPGPWAKVPPFQNVAKSRRIFLTLDQRRRLLDHTEGVFRDLLEAAMLTGARYGELRQLKVEDFDKAARRLEIHKGKTGVRTVALADAAHGFFVRITKGKLPGAPLLPRPDGQSWAHSDQDELMRAAVKAAKLPRETVFYTLRHTFIATALKGGIDIASIAKNCGTSVRIIERNYAKFIPEDVGQQLNKVELV